MTKRLTGAGSFGKRLRAFLKKRGMSQTEFGRQAGLNQSTVSRYAKGASEPRLTEYAKLVKRFPELGG